MNNPSQNYIEALEQLFFRGCQITYPQAGGQNFPRNARMSHGSLGTLWSLEVLQIGRWIHG